jgi:hypothetical protein
VAWAHALDHSNAPDEGFRLRLVSRTQQLAYVVNTMAKSCALVRLSKNAVMVISKITLIVL